MRVIGALLGLLCLLPSTSFAGRLVHLGKWGGLDISLNVRPTAAFVEFDCARGRINGPIVVDLQGRFNASGTFIEDGPGPVTLENPRVHPALYMGDVSGKTMNVTVILVETGETVGTFTLTRGVPALIFKCL